MRLGTLMKAADLEAISGRRVVVLSALPEVPPVLGCSPRLLAPSFEQSHPVDIAAECYAAVSGADAAARLFAEGCLSTEGASVNRTSNDRHWSGNLRLGLQYLFRASGILSDRTGDSLARTLVGCVDDLNSLTGERSEHKSSSKALQWMDALPPEIRRQLEGIYLKGHADTVRSHFRTLMPLLEEIRATAPDMWTGPLLADPDGEPVYVYTPDWGEGPLALLLRVCNMSARAFFILPELHRWAPLEISRVGYAFSTRRGSIDAHYSSAFPLSASGFDADWELYGATSSMSVLSFFRQRLAATGAGDERLKNLAVETPSALDERHAILRNSAGWSLVECDGFDTKRLFFLKRQGEQDSYKERFDSNIASERGMALKRSAAPAAGRRSRSSVEAENVVCVEGVPELQSLPDKGDALYSLEGRSFFVDREVRISPRRHVALLPAGEDEPGYPLILCEKLWTAEQSAGFTSPEPRMISWLSFETTRDTQIHPEKAGQPGKRRVTVSAPFLERDVTLVIPASRSLFPCAGNKSGIIASGAWLEPESVFLVQDLLVVRAPELKDEPRRPFLAHPLQEKCLDAGRELAMHADALLEELREGRDFGESVEAEADFLKSRKKYEDVSRALVKEFFGTLAAKDLAKSGFKPRFRSGMLGRLSKQFPHDLLMLLDYCDFSLARRPGYVLDETPGNVAAPALAGILASRLVALDGFLFSFRQHEDD